MVILSYNVIYYYVLTEFITKLAVQFKDIPDIRLISFILYVGNVNIELSIYIGLYLGIDRARRRPLQLRTAT